MRALRPINGVLWRPRDEPRRALALVGVEWSPSPFDSVRLDLARCAAKGLTYLLFSSSISCNQPSMSAGEVLQSEVNTKPVHMDFLKPYLHSPVQA